MTPAACSIRRRCRRPRRSAPTIASAPAASARGPGRSRREAVPRKVALLKSGLRPLSVPVTCDIFGLTASATDDLGIGQVWEDFTRVADVVLRMVYPSHYYRGAFGFQHPNAEPYRVVYNALKEAITRNRASAGRAEIRPFLQAFTLVRGLPRYTPFEIREEIRAAETPGVQSWVLWNPRSVYPRDALRPYKTGFRVAGVLSGGGE